MLRTFSPSVFYGTRAWACKPREFNTLEMSNVEDKMSLGNGVRYTSPAMFSFLSFFLFLSPPQSPLLPYLTLLRIFFKLFCKFVKRYVFFLFKGVP